MQYEGLRDTSDLTGDPPDAVAVVDDFNVRLIRTFVVSKHQANHARILSLRSTSSALDEQIRSTFTLLTDTRTELLATPATVFPENTNPIVYSELLSYAHRISKFTMPPTFREADTDNGTLEVANVSQDIEMKLDSQGDQHDV